MKEEDDVDDEEDDDRTRLILSNQFGWIHIIYIYICMHRGLLIPPSSVPPACLVVCGVPPCDCWVRFLDLRISYSARARNSAVIFS